MTPAASVAAWSDHASLIVLRSIGKFFGLAGLRLGFVLANAQRLSALAEMIGPWAVSGPAQEIGQLALADVPWQVNMRKRLLAASTRLHTLLARYGINATGTALFQWWPEPQAQAFWQHMAELGVWVRLFTKDTNSIRLGLPHTEEDWLRLENGLASWHLRTPTDAFCVNGEITYEEK
jgi:cobalamin biosynthetic protein CobC